jgi:hypothetical protein
VGLDNVFKLAGEQQDNDGSEESEEDGDGVAQEVLESTDLAGVANE